jgi:hypothetical protein
MAEGGKKFCGEEEGIDMRKMRKNSKWRDMNNITNINRDVSSVTST